MHGYRWRLAAGGWGHSAPFAKLRLLATLGEWGTLDTWTPISSDTMLATLHSSAWRIRTVSLRCQTGKLSNIPQMVYHDHSPTPHLYLVYIFTLHWIAICVIRIITLCLHVCHEVKIRSKFSLWSIGRYMFYLYSVIFIMRPRVRACKLGIFRSFWLRKQPNKS